MKSQDGFFAESFSPLPAGARFRGALQPKRSGALVDKSPLERADTSEDRWIEPAGPAHPCRGRNEERFHQAPTTHRPQVPGSRQIPTTPDGNVDDHLCLLEAFDLLSNGSSLAVPPCSQRLLAFLALRSRPVRREQAAGTLWPDTDRERSDGSLRSALWRLRKAGGDMIESTGRFLTLRTDLNVDLWNAKVLVERLVYLAGDDLDEDIPSTWVVMLSADLLPGWYDDWVVFEAERWHQLRLLGLEALARRLATSGRFGLALLAALEATAAEPLRESAHAAVIAVHLAQGNQAEAINEFNRYRALLCAELGVEPSAHLGDVMRGLHAVNIPPYT